MPLGAPEERNCFKGAIAAAPKSASCMLACWPSTNEFRRSIQTCISGRTFSGLVCSNSCDPSSILPSPLVGSAGLIASRHSKVGLRCKLPGYCEWCLDTGRLHRSEEHTSELQSLRHLA